jgi:hypothetical protein
MSYCDECGYEADEMYEFKPVWELVSIISDIAHIRVELDIAKLANNEYEIDRLNRQLEDKLSELVAQKEKVINS